MEGFSPAATGGELSPALPPGAITPPTPPAGVGGAGIETAEEGELSPSTIATKSGLVPWNDWEIRPEGKGVAWLCNGGLLRNGCK